MSAAVSMTPAEAFYTEELRELAAGDLRTPPPDSPVLFYGSSSIRLWDTLAEDFPEMAVLNRGFGGSTLADCVEFANVLVVPYAPRNILFYAGDNDLDQGATPQQVADSFKALVSIIRGALGDVPVTFLAIKPSPSRWSNLANIVEANRLVEEFIHQEKGLYFLDVFSAMLTSDGQPCNELFLEDGLHLNRAGYDLWTQLLLAQNAKLEAKKPRARRKPMT